MPLRAHSSDTTGGTVTPVTPAVTAGHRYRCPADH